MLQARRISTPLLCAGLRALSCCAAAEGLPTAAAQPGTVSEYSQHVLVRLPGSASAAADGLGAAWPPLVEKEPAVLAAFQAVARSQERGLVAGTVKITAFQDLAGSAQQQQRQQQLPAAAGVGASVLAFPAGLRWDGLSAEQVGLAVALATADNPNTAPLRDSERRQLAALEAPVRDLTLLVCCHTARDARCGTLGPPLATALARAVRQRGLQQHVQVLATSHVGGHKYAGNVVVYGAVHPCDGDWFGGVSEAGAEAFLDALLGVELGVDGGAGDPALRPFWRGRMGLSKQEQAALFEQGGAIEDLGDLGSGSGSSSEEEDEEEEEDGEEERRRRRQQQQPPSMPRPNGER